MFHVRAVFVAHALQSIMIDAMFYFMVIAYAHRIRTHWTRIIFMIDDGWLDIKINIYKPVHIYHIYVTRTDSTCVHISVPFYSIIYCIIVCVRELNVSAFSTLCVILCLSVFRVHVRRFYVCACTASVSVCSVHVTHSLQSLSVFVCERVSSFVKLSLLNLFPTIALFPDNKTTTIHLSKLFYLFSTVGRLSFSFK